MTTGIHQIIDRQIKRWEMEARERRATADVFQSRPAIIRPWVTVSRAFGSGGGEIARRLASKLSYEIIDKEILDVLIQEGHFRKAMVESLDEQDRSSLELWVDGLLHGRLTR